MIDKLRPIVRVKAAYAKGELVKEVFESVAGDVLSFVPYGFIQRPVSEFVRER